MIENRFKRLEKNSVLDAMQDLILNRLGHPRTRNGIQRIPRGQEMVTNACVPRKASAGASDHFLRAKGKAGQTCVTHKTQKYAETLNNLLI